MLLSVLGAESTRAFGRAGFDNAGHRAKGPKPPAQLKTK